MYFLVRKRSNKPFKSGLTTNTVIGMITHPTTGNLAYIFKEDKSWVEVRQANECGGSDTIHFLLHSVLTRFKHRYYLHSSRCRDSTMPR